MTQISDAIGMTTGEFYAKLHGLDYQPAAQVEKDARVLQRAKRARTSTAFYFVALYAVCTECHHRNKVAATVKESAQKIISGTTLSCNNRSCRATFTATANYDDPYIREAHYQMTGTR